jgi:4-hydroxy-3-methylbut-2-enyl diphosphate reductase
VTGVVITPLSVEWAAVRFAGPPVLRGGMGPARAAGSARRLAASARPVVVAGVAGALTGQARPGDLVVATEVQHNGERVPLPSAPLLATSLRRLGLTVHTGPIASAATIVGGPRRARLAADGALAVDLESMEFATGVPGPLAIVRSIVDTPEKPLRGPGTVFRGIAALRALRAAAPVLGQWCDAAGEGEVVLADPWSFCAGVDRAIEIVERALRRFGTPVYVRRQIVHNAHVVRRLEALGAVFVEELDEVPPGATVVLAAHGVAPAVRREAADRDLRVIDATCPLVTTVHNELRRYSARGDTVFLIGHADHEEAEGTAGEAPEHVCYATTNRQRAVRAVAARSDLVLVVGSRNSSNSRRLVEVAEREGTPAHLVEDMTEVDLRWLAGAPRIGVTAGASAPPYLVEELTSGLVGLGRNTVTENPVVDEGIRFTLPREVE